MILCMIYLCELSSVFAVWASQVLSSSCCQVHSGSNSNKQIWLTPSMSYQTLCATAHNIRAEPQGHASGDTVIALQCDVLSSGGGWQAPSAARSL